MKHYIFLSTLVISLSFCLATCKQANEKDTAEIEPTGISEEHTGNNEKGVSVPESKKIKTKLYTSYNERLNNWLHLGISESEIVENIGTADSLSEYTYWGATGMFVQEWYYSEKGMLLYMESDSEKGPKTLHSLKLHAPSDFKTASRIAIGSSSKLVYEMHATQIDSSFSNENTIVVGSVYDGIVFTINDMHVEEIFLGAIAE